MLRTFSLTGHKKPLLLCKRFHTWTEAKSFFRGTVGRKNQFCTVLWTTDRNQSVDLPGKNFLNLRKHCHSCQAPSIVVLKFTSSVLWRENCHLITIRQVSIYYSWLGKNYAHAIIFFSAWLSQPIPHFYLIHLLQFIGWHPVGQGICFLLDLYMN